MDTIQLMRLANGMYQIEVIDRLGALIYIGREGSTIDSAEKAIIDYMFRGRNVDRRSKKSSGIAPSFERRKARESLDYMGTENSAQVNTELFRRAM